VAAGLAQAHPAEEGIHPLRHIASLFIILGLLTACAGQDPDIIEPEQVGPTPTRAAAAFLEPTPEIEPVQFPEDEAPHDMLTEWWYYTGHLFTEEGDRYGFEYVFFQAIRGTFPPYYAAHFAITDNPRGTFSYDERAGPDAIRPIDEGFNLELGDWSMSGALGTDYLNAAMEGYAFDLTLEATKPPALHNDIGYVDLGLAGGSYYYSRTNMSVTGTLVVDGEERQVTGEAWMDHQWGNFISVGAGGWDWFSVQMENNEELTISLILDEEDEVSMSYGTIVFDDGSIANLEMGDFVVEPTDTWESPHTGAVYPSRWTITVPEFEWDIELVPSMPDQELDTTASTGVIYWEGEVEVTGTIGGDNLTGLGYVELTGYASDAMPPTP
jgi:predicted secreted hydrolase